MINVYHCADPADVPVVNVIQIRYRPIPNIVKGII